MVYTNQDGIEYCEGCEGPHTGAPHEEDWALRVKKAGDPVGDALWGLPDEPRIRGYCASAGFLHVPESAAHPAGDWAVVAIPFVPGFGRGTLERMVELLKAL